MEKANAMLNKEMDKKEKQEKLSKEIEKKIREERMNEENSNANVQTVGKVHPKKNKPIKFDYQVEEELEEPKNENID